MIGDRIRQARLAAGMTQGEVVDHLAKAGHPITKAALSKYEKKKSEPKQALLVSLARVLGVKPGHFLSEPQLAVLWLAFRKQAKLSKTKQEQIKAYVEEVVENQAWLRADPLPSADASLPQTPKGADFRRCRAGFPEAPKNLGARGCSRRQSCGDGRGQGRFRCRIR